MRLVFSLNRQQIEIETFPDRRVVDLLREDLGLTGTKESCGSGDCGACTILVDGESRLSCLMLAAQLEGRDVTTIEGFSQGTSLSDLQESFVEYGAVQCGFCTPGMIVAAHDCLERNPHLTRAQIAEGLSGNLCRCTGYQFIIDAVENVSMKRREQQNQ